MAKAYDVVVAGAGHNRLVAAAPLSKAGFTCLVLEAGDAATVLLHDLGSSREVAIGVGVR